MPSRAQKALAATDWQVFLISNDTNHRQSLGRAVRQTKGRVTIVSKYSNGFVLRWRSAVKYDSTRLFLQNCLTGVPWQDVFQFEMLTEAASDLISSRSTPCAHTDKTEHEVSALTQTSAWPKLATLKLSSLLHQDHSQDPFVPRHCDYLGGGTFGKVYRDMRNGKHVALKTLRTSGENSWKLPAAIAEVSTFAAISPHWNLLELLDVEMAASATVILVFPLFEKTLSKRVKESGFMQDEVIFVAKSVLDGLGHLHGHFIIHADVKPNNILIHGAGLPHLQIEDSGDSCIDWKFFAQQLVELPKRQRICIADLGAATLGDPSLRKPENPEDRYVKIRKLCACIICMLLRMCMYNLHV